MYTVPTDDFPFALTEFLKEREMSASALSGLLGHRSKTTLHRVLNREVGPAGVERVYADMMACEGLKLSLAQRQRLSQGMETTRLGPEAARTRQAIQNFLLRQDEGVSEPKVRKLDMEGRSGPRVDMRFFLERLAGMRQCDFIIVNCRKRILFSMLKSVLLDAKNGPACTITHYQLEGVSRADIFEAYDAVLPVLDRAAYKGYFVDASRLPQGLPGEIAQNVILVRAVEYDGRKREWIISFHLGMDGVGRRLSPQQGLYSFWQDRMREYLPFSTAASSSFPAGDSLSAYARLARYYLSLERRQGICMLKPDICINAVHPDVLLSAFKGTGGGAVSGEAVETLYDISRKRYENMTEKPECTCWVLEEKSLLSFTRTGMEKNHFFALRPFSPGERATIFSTLRKTMAQNPGFRIYLLKAPHWTPVDVTVYEKKGMQVSPVITDYNLKSGYREAFIRRPALTGDLCAFFREELIKDHAHPPERTVEFFRQMEAELTRE